VVHKPLSVISSAHGEYEQTIGCVVVVHGEMELHVVGILVDTVPHNDVSHWATVYCEQHRFQEGPLRNANVPPDDG